MYFVSCAHASKRAKYVEEENSTIETAPQIFPSFPISFFFHKVENNKKCCETSHNIN